MRVEVALPAAPSRSQVEALCDALRRRLGRGDAPLVVCDARLLVGQVSAVEALARVALTARRGGAPVCVRDADPALRSLLVLLGLDGVLPEERVVARPRNTCPQGAPVRTVSGALHVLPSGGTP